MATEVKLPRLGQGMEAGTIVRWLKSEGDSVAKGEPLYELDTDKVTQEVEADADGVLLAIVVPEGEVDVGTTVAVIGAEGEAISPPIVDETAREEVQEIAAPVEQVEEAPSETPVSSLHVPEGRVKASPLARRIARERGVDLAVVTGTGPEGRVIAEDVEKAAAAAPAVSPRAAPAAPPEEVEVVELTSVRRTIARRLTEAWEAPVFQLTVVANASQLVATREKLVELVREGDVKPTVSDVLTRLVAAALMRHRAVNAQFVEDRVHRYPTANVGIAVATAQGLMVPVIRAVDRMSVQAIAAARADLVSRARDGKLQYAELEGGTFTISNLGMYGIDQFVAVLNPPQVAILAVGAIEDRPLAVDGELVIAPALTMTLTCDHRAIDGSEGAEFLATVKALVEAPALAL
ncbi:MAG TPA: dihydrolipoamide acetyltransferase family protein [Gaiellaceae bacterium]|nr:dihydrolipoamide acetyltransferase family protein [Gaiellaceae bacterium]